MSILGNYVLPIVLTLIILIALYKKVHIFDVFLQGAKEGLSSTLSITPSLIGLVTAVAMIKASGALDIFSAVISPITSFFGVPSDVIPMALIRPISGSGSTALLDSILKENGEEPTLDEIAKEFNVTREDIVFSFDAIQDPISLQEPIYNDGNESIFILDQVKDPKNTDELWAEKITIAGALTKLNDREKMIIQKRFFDSKTQMEVAEEIGISQAQVSRLEKNAIKNMKRFYK